MPSTLASEVADTSGAAANRSIAAAAGDRAARRKPVALDLTQQRQAALGLVGDRFEEMPGPGRATPGDFGGEGRRTGHQRAGQDGDPAVHPVLGQGGAQWRPLAAAIEPGMDREGGAQQWRMSFRGGREMGRGGADRGALYFVRRRIPPVKVEGVTRGIKDRTTVDRRRRRIETQAHPFD